MKTIFSLQKDELWDFKYVLILLKSQFGIYYPEFEITKKCFTAVTNCLLRRIYDEKEKLTAILSSKTTMLSNSCLFCI